jgi:integrase
LQARHLTGDDLAPDKQTVEAFLLRWLEHVKIIRSPGTYLHYESRCRCHIIPAIGGRKLRSLKTAHVQAMLDGLVAKGLEPSTVKVVRVVIVRALNMARKWSDVKVNVAVDTEIPEVIQKKPPSLNEAQLARLLDTISGNPIGSIVLVALGTGARISECLGLLWSNVDEERQELHITGAIKNRRRDELRKGDQYELVREPFTKTKDQRTTHLPAPIADVFQERWRQQQQDRQRAGKAWIERGLIFTDDHGQPLDPNKISKHFKQVAKRAGLTPDFTFHSLRHSCATFLIKQGEHQRTVMEVLGHRNIRTTARYGTVLPEVTRDALDKGSQRLNRRRGAK